MKEKKTITLSFFGQELLKLDIDYGPHLERHEEIMRAKGVFKKIKEQNIKPIPEYLLVNIEGRANTEVRDRLPQVCGSFDDEGNYSGDLTADLKVLKDMGFIPTEVTVNILLRNISKYPVDFPTKTKITGIIDEVVCSNWPR